MEEFMDTVIQNIQAEQARAGGPPPGNSHSKPTGEGRQSLRLGSISPSTLLSPATSLLSARQLLQQQQQQQQQHAPQPTQQPQPPQQLQPRSQGSAPAVHFQQLHVDPAPQESQPASEPNPRIFNPDVRIPCNSLWFHAASALRILN
eukprot:scaffold1322_cov243-Prasinococcus_capsulatus_cf.AAC.1